MKGFESEPQAPTQCEFGYDAEQASCVVQLPTGETLALTQVTLEEPNERDSFVQGFCPSANAMGTIHLIQEFGKLSVKEVIIDGETLFEIPTIH